MQHATAAVQTAADAVKTASGATTSNAATQAFADAAANAGQLWTRTFDGTGTTVQAAGDRVQEAFKSMTEQAKQAGVQWLSSYEQNVSAFLQLRTTMAQATKVDAVIELAAANNRAIQQLTSAYVSSVRELLN